MNLLDCEVTEVLGIPYQIEPPKYWFVDVKYNCYGRDSEASVMLKTRSEADNIAVGYIFQG